MVLLVAVALAVVVLSLLGAGAPGRVVALPRCASLVEVVGRVERQGVVCASSVRQALRRAGGVRGCREEDAGRRSLVGGQRVLVSLGTTGGCRVRIGTVAGQLRLSLGMRIDVNRAGTADLRALPGIGPRLAARIVASRKARGAFRRARDLLRVRGIGPRTLRRLRGLLLPREGSSDWR